jgi:hypothetical protein
MRRIGWVANRYCMGTGRNTGRCAVYAGGCIDKRLSRKLEHSWCRYLLASIANYTAEMARKCRCKGSGLCHVDNRLLHCNKLFLMQALVANIQN